MANPNSEYVQSGGTYFLTNVKGGTALDLSGTDGKSIIGWPYHNGTNQQWKLNWTSIGWTFQNVASNLYLGVNGQHAQNATLVGVQEPVGWHIWHDEEHPENYRVFVPQTTLNLDLSEYGRSVPGQPVILWGKWNGTHQTWKFTKT